MNPHCVAAAFPKAVPNELVVWQQLANGMRQGLANAFAARLEDLLGLDPSATTINSVNEFVDALATTTGKIGTDVLSAPEACAWEALAAGLCEIRAGEKTLPTIAQAWQRLFTSAPDPVAYLTHSLAVFTKEIRRQSQDVGPILNNSSSGRELRSYLRKSLDGPNAYPLLNAIVPSEQSNAAGWHSVLLEALDLLDYWSPTFAAATCNGIQLTLPWPKSSAVWFPHQIVEQHYPSGSVGFLPGICWIAKGSNAIWTAEALVHESCHQILHVIENALPLIADEQARGHSPWQTEPRSFRGIMHGFFAFGHVLLFLRHMAEVPLTSLERSYVKGRSRFLEAQLRVAREEFVKSTLTQEGHQLVADLFDFLALKESMPTPLIKAVVRARREAQHKNQAPKTEADLVTEVLAWVDQHIASANVCPYAGPSLEQDGTQVVVLPGKHLSDVLFDVIELVQHFITPKPPGVSDCLIIALPDLQNSEIASLNSISPEHLLSLNQRPKQTLANLNLKTRVFDPDDTDSHRPPVPLWVLRAAMPDGR